jgi:hypothetical protein
MRRPASTLRGDQEPSDPVSGTNERDQAPSLADAVHAAVAAGDALIRAGLGVVVSRMPSTPTAVRTAATSARAALVYELLDAHADTADLAAELPHDPRWAAHLDYLRALQRTGREALAHSSVEDDGL